MSGDNDGVRGTFQFHNVGIPAGLIGGTSLIWFAVGSYQTSLKAHYPEYCTKNELEQVRGKLLGSERAAEERFRAIENRLEGLPPWLRSAIERSESRIDEHLKDHE